MAGENGGGAGRRDVAVVMVPLPAQGHLNQLLHLSRLLASNLTVYYTGASTHLLQARTRVQGWDPTLTHNLHFHEFENPTFESPEPDSKNRYPVHLFPAFHASLLLREPLLEFLQELSGRFKRVVVIYDSLMAWNVQDIGSIPNAESYSFLSCSAFSIYSFIWELMQKPPLPPGAEALKDLPNLDLCMSKEFDEFNKYCNEAVKCNSGTIFNSSRIVEGVFLDLLANNPIVSTGQQWAIGPFNPVTLPENHDPNHRRHRCLDWLDEQPRNSVIFVSFGSTTALSEEQIKQIAIGLSESGQRFIWSLRTADKANIFSGDSRDLELPEKIEELINDRGLIVSDWAPQLEILAHESTGGFMSHCGWNSIMEAISFGVPIAAWPVHSDQPRNAILVTKVLEIGVEVDDCTSNDVVGSARVAEAVKKLMCSSEGDKMRRRAEDLSQRVKLSMAVGGSSHEEMESFVSHITRD